MDMRSPVELTLAGDLEKLRFFERDIGRKIEKIGFRSPIYSLREQIGGSYLTLRYKKAFQVFHFPHYNIPWFSQGKVLVTLHDLIHLLFPQYFSSKKVFFAKRLLQRVGARAERIIADSDSTRNDFLRLLPEAADKTTVIPIGVDGKFTQLPLQDVESFRKAKGVERFILFVGNRKPHKNLIGLLRAFTEIREKVRDYRLVVIANGDVKDCEIEEQANRLGDRIIEPGPVNDGELVLYYNAATLLVCPSLYEGFGLAPLEAMACGCPVITSNTSSLPEVVGDAGIMTDPNDVEALAGEMIRVLTDPTLRAEMSEKGLARARLFSWEKCARETIGVYEEIAGR